MANRENEYYESDSLDSEKFFNQQRAGKPMAALQAQGKDSAGGTAMPPSLASSCGSVTGKQRKRLNIALLRRGGLKGNSNYSSSGTLMNQVGSLTQLYSVDFSQSSISVKSVFSTSARSRFASVEVHGVLGPLHLARHT